MNPNENKEQVFGTIARFLGHLDTETVGLILRGESSAERDLQSITTVAEDCRLRALKALNGEASVLNGKELEDAGAKAAGLPTVSEVLEEYNELRTIRDELVRSVAISTYDILQLQNRDANSKHVNGHIEVGADTLTPPDEGRMIERGSGNGMHKEFQERFATLQMILLDMGIDPRDPKQVRILLGPVRENMMREVSYTSVFVPALGRLVELCNEVGNRSFIWKTSSEADIQRFGLMTKEDKLEELKKNPELGWSMIMQRGWEEAMRGLLQSEGHAAKDAFAKSMLRVQGERKGFHERVEELKRWREEHPDKWPRKNTPLSSWLNHMRRMMRDGGLSDDQQHALYGLGVVPARVLTDIFNQRLQELKQWRKDHPDEWPRTDKTSLGAWLNSKRMKLRDGRLSDKQQQALRDLGVTEARIQKDIFGQRLQELKQWRKDHPHEWPHSVKTSLGKWLQQTRMKLRHGGLSDSQQKALRKLGVTEAIAIVDFNARIEELKRWREGNPNQWPIAKTALSIWLHGVRGKLRDGGLSDEQQKALHDLGVTEARIQKDMFAQRLQELQQWRKDHPHEWPHTKTSLGQWLNSVRAKLRDGGLSEEQQKSLRDLGVTESKTIVDFNTHIEELKQWRKDHPDEWPSTHTPLGRWLQRMRAELRDGSLSEVRQQVLRKLGVTEPRVQANIFDQRLQELQEWRQDHPDEWPHTRTSLGAWLQAMRAKLRDGGLSDEQQKALRDLEVIELRVARDVFNEYFERLQQWHKDHPGEWPSIKTPLGLGLRSLRFKLRDGGLTEEQVKQLRSLGISEPKRRKKD